MTIRREWIKTVIEAIAQAVGSVLGLKAKGELAAAIAESEKAVRRAFGMDPKLALGLPIEEFLRLACRGEEPEGELLESLAALFEAWADALQAQGRAAESGLARERAAQARAWRPPI